MDLTCSSSRGPTEWQSTVAGLSSSVSTGTGGSFAARCAHLTLALMPSIVGWVESRGCSLAESGR